MAASKLRDVLTSIARAGDQGAREFPLMNSLGMSRDEFDPIVNELQRSHQIVALADPMDSKARRLKATRAGRDSVKQSQRESI
jgi:hypothetical protein